MKSTSLTSVICLVLFQFELNTCSYLHKRNFANIGCYGDFDIASFARLDRVCEECYQTYRSEDLYKLCRKDCFHNEDFVKCVDALLLNHERDRFQNMVRTLRGKSIR